jgi:hypothetical protein
MPLVPVKIMANNQERRKNLSRIYIISDPNIHALRYDEEDGRLAITYNDAKTRVYLGVPADVFQSLKQSKQKTIYIQRNIQSTYQQTLF